MAVLHFTPDLLSRVITVSPLWITPNVSHAFLVEVIRFLA